MILPWRRGKPQRSFKNKFWLGVFWTLLFLGMSGGYAFYFRHEIFAFLLAPADGKLSPDVPGFEGKPVFTSPLTMVGVTISIVAKVSAIGAMPVALYWFLSLLKPWIPHSHWKLVVWVSIATVVSYLLGWVFVYTVMMPVAMGFLLGKFGSDTAVALIDIGQYFDLLFALTRAMGIVFLIPVVMFVITTLTPMKYRHWRWGRFVVPIFATILGIFLTPSVDGVNFVMVGLPVMGLYEIGLFATWMVDREDGNYLWINSIKGRFSLITDGATWLAHRPVIVYRKVRSVLMTHGIWW